MSDTDRLTAPDGVQWVCDMGPLERAYAEAHHELCDEGEPHLLSAHEPWSGDEIGEPWDDFMARLARHGLTLSFARPAPDTPPDALREAARRSLSEPGHMVYGPTGEFTPDTECKSCNALRAALEPKP